MNQDRIIYQRAASSRLRTLLLLAAAFTLAACAPLQQYRTQLAEPCVSVNPGVECTEYAVHIYDNPDDPDRAYSLSFVEFDDQGQLYDRQQMQSVLDHVASELARGDAIIVLFAHGWKHNASPAEEDDGDIETFRDALMRLSLLESEIRSAPDGNNPAGLETRQQSQLAPRRVVGIYLGWRGASIELPLLRELTFWDRKNTAHKVGDGGVAELLARLEQMQKTQHIRTGRDGQAPDTRLAVIGHSFGAAVLYTALDKTLVNRFVFDEKSPDVVGSVEGYGDLVVLVNPAFEAIRFTTLSDMANERRTYFRDQLPLIAVLTSEQDRATKNAFPIGRWFSTLFEQHRTMHRENPVDGSTREIRQSQANRTAIGHFEPYRTHWLRPDPAPALLSPFQRFAEVSRGWEEDAPGGIIRFDGAQLIRTENSVSRNPYLVISVDQEIIPNHNDIDDDVIINFIAQLIQISTQPEDPEVRQMLRTSQN